MRWLVLIPVALVACGGGDGDSEHADAVEAWERQAEYLSDGQYGRLYDELHPEHRALIDEETFFRCQNAMSVELGGIDMDVKETFVEDVTIPGTDVEVESVAITVEFSVPGFPSESDTFHEIEVDGEWYWTVADLSTYEDC